MASISQAKGLGAVGSMLVLLTLAPSIGPLLGIVGFFLILWAIKDIADAVQDKSIFNNALLSLGMVLTGAVAGVIVLLGSLLSFMGAHNLGFTDFASAFDPASIPLGDWLSLIGSALAGLAVVWLMLLGSSVFIRRTYGAIASRLDDGMFRWAGLLFLVGAATTVVLVGFAILFVAQVLLVVAFLTLDPSRV